MEIEEARRPRQTGGAIEMEEDGWPRGGDAGHYAAERKREQKRRVLRGYDYVKLLVWCRSP
jgi:hypothetical protein